jgi:hypothetical protein
MHGHELKSIGLGPALRAINAGGFLRPIAEPFYSGGYSYTHVLHTARGAAYRVARSIAAELSERATERNAFTCAARGCDGCSKCGYPAGYMQGRGAA